MLDCSTNASGQPPRRLLPWTGAEGKPCFLSTDDERSYVSRLADNIESVQLGMGSQLLVHAEEMLADCKVSANELHFLAARLTEALRDSLRVAQSRGARLQPPDHDGETESPD